MMKKMREKGFKKVYIVLMILMVLSLSACKSKDPITAGTFKEKLESQDYEITDMAEQYKEHEHIKAALITEKDSVHIEFFEVDSKDNAAGMFNGNKQTVSGFKSGGTKESSVSTGSYQKYSLTTSDTFYNIIQVGNTLVYSRCDEADKEVLQSIIEDLGY